MPYKLTSPLSHLHLISYICISHLLRLSLCCIAVLKFTTHLNACRTDRKSQAQSLGRFTLAAADQCTNRVSGPAFANESLFQGVGSVETTQAIAHYITQTRLTHACRDKRNAGSAQLHPSREQAAKDARRECFHCPCNEVAMGNAMRLRLTSRSFWFRFAVIQNKPVNTPRAWRDGT